MIYRRDFREPKAGTFVLYLWEVRKALLGIIQEWSDMIRYTAKWVKAIAALPVLAMALVFVLSGSAIAQDKPQWIWATAGEPVAPVSLFVRTVEITGKPKSVVFAGACDNRLSLFVNGQQVVEHGAWESAVRENVTKLMKDGANTFAIRGTNEGGIAAFLGQIEITAADGKVTKIVTDGTWKSTDKQTAGWQKPGFDVSGWGTAKVIGNLGDKPWGNVSLTKSKPVNAMATTEESIKLLPGFKVEMLYSVPKDKEGSWVSMCSDDKGRLIVCDQYGGLYRVTPGANAEATKVEKLELAIGEAQGLLFLNKSLYIVVNGQAAKGSGLYRATDTNGDGELDKVDLLKKFDGGGEHGPHAVRLGPDGKLYVVAGNFTKVPEGYDPASPAKNWAEDLLLPRNPDGGGHDPHIMSPAGWVGRCDLDGKQWELIATGLRNTYDIGFNADGELFNYDSDMEWDTGTPWYRPTRVNHIVSGGEYGWRNGTGKWPEYSPDSLGAVVNIGLGSPTGVEFGYGAKFPAKYQKAFFINDWTYGKIYAVHMTPTGATYTGTFETFIEGRPLPVTDIVVHTDGALYFMIGGRKTQSGLYRVTYAGTESTAPIGKEVVEAAAKARETRKQLEVFHQKQDPKAVATAWPYLGSGDRALRFAARVAIENQPLAQWQEQAFAETRPTAVIHAMLAVARSGEKSLLPKVVEKLNSLPLERLTEDQQTAAMRAYGLAFIRLGAPDEKLAATAAKRVITIFPNQSDLVNREASALLVYLKEPGVVAPSMKLLKEGQSQEDQLYYVLVLRNVCNLLNQEQRHEYFGWINLAQQTYRGGNSFVKFLDKIRADAAEKLTADERTALKDVLEEKKKVEVVKLETTRQFVHNWQTEDLISDLPALEKGRSFEKGKLAYQAGQCYKCHRFDGQGGDTGPDITGVGARFSPLYILESLSDPSKAVSDQYLGSVIVTSSGDVVTGRVVEEDAKKIKVRTSPFATQLTEILKEDIESRQLSKVSEMPQGLINTLTKEEVLDLLAYLRSAGKATDAAFSQ